LELVGSLAAAALGWAAMGHYGKGKVSLVA